MNMLASLKNHFLIAMPHQVDESFSESLVYICEHSEEGAMGIVVNRSLPISLKELITQLSIEPVDADQSFDEENTTNIYLGGPCQNDHGFILHDGLPNWESSVTLDNNIVLSSSKDILIDIMNNKGPDNYLVALGYAGWEAGQLESELANNAWLTCPGTQNILFNILPENKWQTAATEMGIDINLIGTQIGLA